MKQTVLAFSMMLPVLVGCRPSPQPAATSPLSTLTPVPTDTSIPGGLEWTVYSIANSGLPADTICDLATSAEGRIWVGT